MASMEKFTQRARRVLSLAQLEAERARQGLIGTEHLLLGLLSEEGVAGRVLRELGLEVERVREMIQRLGGEGRYTGGRIELAPETQQALEFSLQEARTMGHHYVGTEHLLLGLMRAGGMGVEVLQKLGVTEDQVRRQVRRVLQESSSPAPASVSESPRQPGRQEAKTPLVDQLATDLTSLAEQARLDPVIGRQMEIERVIQILARRTSLPAHEEQPGAHR